MVVKSTKNNLLTISSKNLSDFLHIRDEVESYLKQTLKFFPLDELIDSYKKAVASAELINRPTFYIEPMSLVQTFGPNVVVSLCLDIKHHELYEYDNHKHSHCFSIKADQQFKLLYKICESNDVYIPTSELMKVAGYRSVASTYKAIEKINSVGYQIGLPERLLIGSEGQGYRINQNYTVTVI